VFFQRQLRLRPVYKCFVVERYRELSGSDIQADDIAILDTTNEATFRRLRGNMNRRWHFA
jgi:hypothetical protein